MVLQPQKGTFCIPEYKEHSLKIWCESLDNYYLLAFTKKIQKFAEKATFNFFTQKLTKILKK